MLLGSFLLFHTNLQYITKTRLFKYIDGPPPIGASRNRWAAWCFRGLAGDRTVLVNRLEGLSRLTLPRKSLVLVSLQGLSVIYLKLGKNPTNSEARLQNDWNNVDGDVKLQIKQTNILIISPPKTESFRQKFWHFSYFCSKHRLWVLRKIMYTSVNPSFTI